MVENLVGFPVGAATTVLSTLVVGTTVGDIVGAVVVGLRDDIFVGLDEGTKVVGT